MFGKLALELYHSLEWCSSNIGIMSFVGNGVHQPLELCHSLGMVFTNRWNYVIRWEWCSPNIGIMSFVGIMLNQKGSYHES